MASQARGRWALWASLAEHKVSLCLRSRAWSSSLSTGAKGGCGEVKPGPGSWYLVCINL